MRAQALAAWPALVVVTALGCGPGSRSVPSAPSTAASVTVRVAPEPPTLRRMGGLDTPVYALDARVTFRVSNGGDQARIVSLELVLFDASGQVARQAVAVDVKVAPGADASVALPGSVLVTSARVPTRLSLITSAVDSNGQPLAVPVIEVPVALEPPDASAAPSLPVTFAGAGDIADCGLTGAALTARAVQRMPGSVFTLGDHVYPDSTYEAFTSCYESTWGAVKARTYPTPGNHDWDLRQGEAYLNYFGGVAANGFYSFDLGAWHVLSLNSNVAAQPGSRQYEWARADLSTHPRACTLAYWHHPVFSSGPNGPNSHMRAMWQLLDEAGVDVVMAGHDHFYERFAPQDADGRPTSAGIRQFVVGTGGTHLYDMLAPQANSEVRSNQAWGVLKLTLRSDRYDWEFVPVGDGTFRDFGSATCGG